MTATVERMTAEELLRLPDDGFRCELVRGKLRKRTLAGAEQGRLTVVLMVSLFQHVQDSKLGVAYAGGTGFLLSSDPDTVRAPDVAFVRRERIEEVGAVEGYWPGAPDLAVEVVSPNDQYSEVESKVADWLEAGSRMVVVVDPRRRKVTVHRSRSDIRILGIGEVLEGGEVVPGWKLPIDDLFA
ncbi:MAG: Uma2 family endonuclease [Candidatus Latescibacteria bacterium]|nr:Uma2 family endonuclease [Candidatus Latescibacterota bacterium]